MQSKKRKKHSHKARRSAPAKPAAPKKSIFAQWWFWLIPIALVVGLAALLIKGAVAEPDPTKPHYTVPTAEYTTCQVGETFDANGLHITYAALEEWLPEGETEHPKSGYVFIRLKIVAENKSTEVREIYSNEFNCYADGFKEVEEYFSDEKLAGGFLNPGDRQEGYIYFTVPTDATAIEVIYESLLYWQYHRVVLPVTLSK